MTTRGHPSVSEGTRTDCHRVTDRGRGWVAACSWAVAESEEEGRGGFSAWAGGVGSRGSAERFPAQAGGEEEFVGPRKERREHALGRLLTQEEKKRSDEPK